MFRSRGHYIDGHWERSSDLIMNSTNPCTGEVLWQGSHASHAQVKNAFQAASKAAPGWAQTSFENKTIILRRFAALIRRNSTVLAQLIALETGKPLWESHTEVSAVIGKINLSIQAYQERSWPHETLNAEVKSCLRFKPQGIVVVLGAFNFPAHLSNGHIIPALLAGNTILYKPSEQAPAVAEFIMQCWHDCGLPAGVINCLQGNAACAKSLLDQDIQGVYFTGSYATGQRIHQQLSSRPEVVLALEMGGNNPLVIGDIEDIKACVYQTILSSFITAGQRCSCARRLIIPETEKGRRFLQQLIETTQSITVNLPNSNPQPFMGAVISNQQAMQALMAQERLRQLGGKSLLNMTLIREHTGLLTPGIIDMSAVPTPPDEEIFAPFLQVYFYKDFEQAIQQANQTKYGLTAGLFSKNPNEYSEFYQSIKAGLINWNRPTTGASSALPFGGIGRSGNHRASGYFAADYCSYPIACQEQEELLLPQDLLPGITL